MKLRIAARSSDLARIQAYAVGDALKRIEGERLSVEYSFRKSLGDINLNDPLWKMPEKGVFTEDFREDLLQGAVDLVVHSWKDLPIESREGTEVVATLPRADFRDLLLFKRSSLSRLLNEPGGAVRILSSSPRRAYNLSPFFAEFLPGQPVPEFVSVRGNVPTRVRKWKTGQEDGLIVAKAAIDRILQTTDPQWEEARSVLSEALKGDLWMVLPIAVNPPAAAQGALAIEIRSDREEIRELLRGVQCEETFHAVQEERRILQSYGGGCHQKIGVGILRRPFGQVRSLRGMTDQGVRLDSWDLLRFEAAPIRRVSRERIWPASDEDRTQLFVRIESAVANPGRDLWVTRGNALPEAWTIPPEQVVWTAGLETWKKLARRGIWVHGSAEGLGEQEAPRMELLLNAQQGRSPDFVKLSHRQGYVGAMPILPTYELRPDVSQAASIREALSGKTHFFWMSGSLFASCLELVPEIRKGFHSCGPGNTLSEIREILGPQASVRVCLGVEHWRKEILE